MPYATYRFNKIIAAETIRFIVTVAIVVYKGLKLVVYRMLTIFKPMKIDNDAIAYPAKSLFGPALSNTVSSMAMSNDILFK